MARTARGTLRAGAAVAVADELQSLPFLTSRNRQCGWGYADYAADQQRASRMSATLSFDSQPHTLLKVLRKVLNSRARVEGGNKNLGKAKLFRAVWKLFGSCLGAVLKAVWLKVKKSSSPPAAWPER